MAPLRRALLTFGGAAALAALSMAALTWLWPHFPPLDWEASVVARIAIAVAVAVVSLVSAILYRRRPTGPRR